jgi:hypothetical protein
MHGHRLAQHAIGVAEVHDQHVADLGVQRRAWERRRGLDRREPGRRLGVGVRAEDVPAGDRAVVPVVAPGGDDAAPPRHRLDPVLAPHAAGLGLELRHVLRRRSARPAHPGGRRVGLAERLRRVDHDLLAADRAQQRRAARQAEEGASCGRAVGHGARGS